MSFDVEQHVRYRIANAPVQRFPFAHFYVENVFPEDFYRRLLSRLPETSEYQPINETGTVTEGTYAERYVLDIDAVAERDTVAGQLDAWPALEAWMMDDDFARFIVQKFQPAINERFGQGAKLGLSTEGRLVRDFTRYAIPPHTDNPRKLVSLLFYLPPDASQRHLGTSIYLPTDPAFRSEGGAHYSRKGFKHVARAEFLPNSLFAFVRTDFSFHGVEPIADEKVERNLLLYNVYVPKVVAPSKPAADASRAA